MSQGSGFFAKGPAHCGDQVEQHILTRAYPWNWRVQDFERFLDMSKPKVLI